MMLSPAPNPLDIFRSTKVTTVLGLIQPLGLSGNLNAYQTTSGCQTNAQSPAARFWLGRSPSAARRLHWPLQSAGAGTVCSFSLRLRRPRLKLLLRAAHRPVADSGAGYPVFSPPGTDRSWTDRLPKTALSTPEPGRPRTDRRKELHSTDVETLQRTAAASG